MKTRHLNLITIVCILVTVSACTGTAYAAYTASLADTETIYVENHYGTATLSESAGVYTLHYEDTDADAVYLSVTVAGLSSDVSVGGVVDLWFGAEDAIGDIGSVYTAAVSGSSLTALSKPLQAFGSTYSDGDVDFTVTCAGSAISVSVGGTPLAVTNGNFTYGTSLYIVDASDSTVNSVCRIIPIYGNAGSYRFDDGGYGYVLTCSGGSVTSAVKCEAISTVSDGRGIAVFSTITTGLTSKNWSDTVALYSGYKALDLGSYYVNVVFYSPGPSS